MLNLGLLYCRLLTVFWLHDCRSAARIRQAILNLSSVIGDIVLLLLLQVSWNIVYTVFFATLWLIHEWPTEYLGVALHAQRQLRPVKSQRAGQAARGRCKRISLELEVGVVSWYCYQHTRRDGTTMARHLCILILVSRAYLY